MSSSQPLKLSQAMGIKRSWEGCDDTEATGKETTEVDDEERGSSAAKKGKIEQSQSSAPTGVGRTAGLFSAASVQAAKRNGTYQPLGMNKTLSAPSASKNFGAFKDDATKKGVASIFLSPEQKHVLDLVGKGKNVFFTGSAGTGKSVLLRQIIADLRRKNDKNQDAVAVTASTGIAACNIGGMTLHSFAGFGLGKGPVETLIAIVLKNRRAATRWMRTKVLIIDEISMVDAELFDKMQEIARRVRKMDKPFGGIQVIVTGDFFQLPPVGQGQTSFAFEAKEWESTMEVKFNLTKVFRQTDPTFVSMLNEMRLGKISAASAAKFKSLNRTPKYAENITPTELFPRREDVDKANQVRLTQTQGATMSYDSTDNGTIPAEQRTKILSNFLAPQKLTLRVGAQVMLLKNHDETLVNGSIGEVLDFLTPEEYSKSKQVVVQDDSVDDFLRGRATKQAAESAARKSRSVSPEKGRMSVKLPLVRFALPNGQTRDHLVELHLWKNEASDNTVLASRLQIPLVLAWAMSIHKAQGQTLNCCKVDLRRVFEKGQAYVAISRATSLDGLQVLNFDESKVLAHPKVIAWSKNLSTRA